LFKQVIQCQTRVLKDDYDFEMVVYKRTNLEVAH